MSSPIKSRDLRLRIVLMLTMLVLGAKSADLLPTEYTNTASLACSNGALACSAFFSNMFSLTPSMDTNQQGVVSALWYFHGIFSANLRLYPGSGTTVTNFVLKSNAVNAKDKNLQEIALQLYLLPGQGQTVLRASAITNQKLTYAEFHLPFDGSLAFHKYTIRWGLRNIYFMVDDQPLHSIGMDPQSPWPAEALRPQVFCYSNLTLLTSPTVQLRDFSKAFAKLAAAQAAAATAAAQKVAVGQQNATVAKDFNFVGCKCAAGQNNDPCPVQAAQLTSLPWEQPLTADQFKAYNSAHYKFLTSFQNWLGPKKKH